MVDIEYRGEGDAAPCCGATDLETRCYYTGIGTYGSMKQVPHMPQAQHAIWALAHGAMIEQASHVSGLISQAMGWYARDLGLFGRPRD